MFNLHILSDKRIYGDLYNLCYLPRYKSFAPPCPYKSPLQKNRKKVRLVIIGDSFTEKMADSNFVANKYDYVNWYNQLRTPLDTTWYNVLIIETAERYMHRLEEENNDLVIENTGRTVLLEKYKMKLSYKIIQRIFGNEIIEQNLEAVFFSNEAVNKLKELKAAFNYYVFSRISSDVVESPGKKRLYLANTIGPLLSSSSFSDISDQAIQMRVNGIRQLNARYKKAGFNRVVFSIIPNAVSVVEPGLGNYNHQIERIQNSLGTNCEYIDAYKMLKPAAASNYYYNDTHWNCVGRNLWLQSVNDILDPKQ